MREQIVVREAAPLDLRPRCEDCHVATFLRATMLDPRDGHRVAVYQCGNCSRLAWRD